MLAQRLEKLFNSNKGYKVVSFRSIEEVLESQDLYTADLVILDLVLQGRPGQDLLIELKKKIIDLPILVLSALDSTEKKVELLNLGVDDFLTKPFENSELLARVKALVRRVVAIDNQQLVGGISFDWRKCLLIREKKKISLTQRECELLRLLVKAKGSVVSIEKILIKVWGFKPGYHSNVVQTTIKRLRKKVDEGFETSLIGLVHGKGYFYKY